VNVAGLHKAVWRSSVRSEAPTVTEIAATPPPDVPVPPAPTIVWPVGEQRQLLGMPVWPDDDDDQPATHVIEVDFSFAVGVTASIGVPG
jgi:hypothetical protein